MPKKALLRRLCGMMLCFAAAGLALILGLSAYVKQKTETRILTAEEAADLDADCILVLGCGIREDGTPSHMLEDRLLTGISLYDAGVSNRLLMSGDHGSKDYDEVNLMKNFAKERGIPSECIFMDHAGFSTYESIVRAKEVFQAKKIVVVSQAYHLPRAIYLADCLGLEAYGVSADLRIYRAQFYRQWREALARAKDVFFGILQPNPTYLGEPIPIWGDGDLTNDQL